VGYEIKSLTNYDPAIILPKAECLTDIDEKQRLILGQVSRVSLDVPSQIAKGGQNLSFAELLTDGHRSLLSSVLLFWWSLLVISLNKLRHILSPNAYQSSAFT
jgi:hypothetical protein